MKHKEYQKVSDFRGKLSKDKNPDDWAFTRGQYVMTLLKAKDYLRK